MDYTVKQVDSYEDTIVSSFELTIKGETRYFDSPIQPALLELDDGTVLDVEITQEQLNEFGTFLKWSSGGAIFMFCFFAYFKYLGIPANWAPFVLFGSYGLLAFILGEGLSNYGRTQRAN